MYTVLVWAHVCLIMVAFGASPLGRLGLRYLLSRSSGPQSAQAILRGFSGIFLAGGISVTAGVCIGLVLAWDSGLTQRWVAASLALITIAGVGGVAIEDRWVRRLSRAEGDAFVAILHEKVPFLAAYASPVLWLYILWLMIQKPV
jgi:UDP-N-acetylmuramyl pentapeptide phosphotransferase/UDP-N-acetylglucosamine-1-phosphate transferase